MAKSCIFHELVELSRDEEIAVRIASLETLVDLLDFFERSESVLIILCYNITAPLSPVQITLGILLYRYFINYLISHSPIRMVVLKLLHITLERSVTC